jgi:hypothetical protein
MSSESTATPPDAAPLLVHIGYHKTATSWMQDVLFRPACGYQPLMSHAEVFERISGPHPLAFDPEPARLLIAERASAAAPGLARVVSSEILSGNPFRGGQDSPETARRLQRIAPGAQILVTIREQVSMAASMYMQYVSQAGTLRVDRFFAGPLAIGHPLFDPVHLEYHRLIALYRELFGPDRVHVLTFEEFRAAPERFVMAIARIAGLPEQTPSPALAAESGRNVSSPEYAAPFLRRLNHFRSGPVSPDPVLDLGVGARLTSRGIGRAARAESLRRLVKRRNPVKDFVAEKFAGHFEDSNRSLAALCPDLDLRGYQGIAPETPGADAVEPLRPVPAGH